MLSRTGRTFLFIFLFFCFAMPGVYAQHNFWQVLNLASDPASPDPESGKSLTVFTTFQLDAGSMFDWLRSPPSGRDTLRLPLPDGTTTRFLVKEDNFLAPKVRADHPEILHFSGYGLDQPGAVCRVGWTGVGFAGVIRSPEGMIFIRPESSGEGGTYHVYSLEDYHRAFPELSPACGVDESFRFPALSPGAGMTGKTSGDIRREYDLAIAATGEYTAEFGSVANAYAAIQTTLMTVNLVYETEFSIRFILVTGQNTVYGNPATDPYPDGGPSGNIGNLLNQNQTNLDNVLTSAGYDIGHVFDAFDSGILSGIASLQATCVNDRKAKGASRGAGGGSFQPAGPIFDVELVCHELGHQFNAHHTFNSLTGNCGNQGQRYADSAFEPGSGSTIMSYTTCGDDNLQSRNDGYFHTGSYDEVMNYIAISGGCSTNVATGNTPPTADAGSNFTIPHSTPFVLTGSAADPDAGASLTYCWEGVDLGPAGSPSADDPPYFRSYLPSADPSRTFPRLTNILDGSNENLGEHLPNGTETLNLRLTVRDNQADGGGVDYDAVQITVASSGPFLVTSQNTTEGWLADGSNTATITWSVNGTTAAPVNCSQVNILLSTDGGQTFPTILAANTPNDGSEAITIPGLPTVNGRVKVEAAGNIFFDINNADIIITTPAGCDAEGLTFSPDDPFSAPVGDPGLSFNLSPDYGLPMSTTDQNINVGDPTYNFTTEDGEGSGVCASFTVEPHYDLIPFSVDVSGEYSIGITNGSDIVPVLNRYADSFSSADPCTNWQASNGYYDSGSGDVNWSYPFVSTYTAGTNYFLVVSGLSTGTLGSYTLTFSGPGTVYNGPAPPAGYDYTFVVVDGSGTVKGFDPGPDLSDPASYPEGTYTIRGLSVLNSTDLTAYRNQSFTVLQNDIQNAILCADLSDNSKAVTVTGVLPVAWLAFTGRRAGEEVQLDWQTAAEFNNEGFYPERSVDGRDWETLAFVPGAGRPDKGAGYRYVDQHPLPGRSYYRVRQQDLDGRIAFSQVISIFFNGENQSLQLYPVPVSDELTVVLAGDAQAGTYQVMDALGRPLLDGRFEQSGFRISLTALPAGTYFLVLRTGKERWIRRFLKK